MTNLEERQAFAKLEALKDIRAKTIGLEKTRASLLCDVGQLEDEERCLQEYRRELELLQQEKMAHVEELRQIHADINAMEAIIKQAEESKRIAQQDSARKLLSEYVPLVQDVNRMRVELLELDKLPDIPDSEKDRLKAAGILDKDKSLSDPWPKPLTNHTVNDDSTVKYDWPNWFSVKSVGNEMLIPNSLSMPTPPTHNPFFSMTRQPSPLFGSLGLSKTGFCPPSSINPMPNPPPFRYQQQPPPMKSCLSCHQQIHRNAPICPLCKAKSRSRNPKKPKKKE